MEEKESPGVLAPLGTVTIFNYTRGEGKLGSGLDDGRENDKSFPGEGEFLGGRGDNVELSGVFAGEKPGEGEGELNRLLGLLGSGLEEFAVAAVDGE